MLLLSLSAAPDSGLLPSCSRSLLIGIPHSNSWCRATLLSVVGSIVVELHLAVNLRPGHAVGPLSRQALTLSDETAGLKFQSSIGRDHDVGKFDDVNEMGLYPGKDEGVTRQGFMLT